MWEFAKGTTFGATAFTSYGAFWISFWYLTGHTNLDGVAAGDVADGIGPYLLAWGLFTAYMTVAASRARGAVLVVFALLTLTFLVLAWGEFAASDAIHHIGGWLGLATARRPGTPPSPGSRRSPTSSPSFRRAPGDPFVAAVTSA